MKIIGEKLSNQEMLSVKGGGSCYQCTCGGGQVGSWLQTASSATSSQWLENCGAGNTGTCESTENPHCPSISQ
jgi:hypothetical protein